MDREPGDASLRSGCGRDGSSTPASAPYSSQETAGCDEILAKSRDKGSREWTPWLDHSGVTSVSRCHHRNGVRIAERKKSDRGEPDRAGVDGAFDSNSKSFFQAPVSARWSADNRPSRHWCFDEHLVASRRLLWLLVVHAPAAVSSGTLDGAAGVIAFAMPCASLACCAIASSAAETVKGLSIGPLKLCSSWRIFQIRPRAARCFPILSSRTDQS